MVNRVLKIESRNLKLLFCSLKSADHMAFMRVLFFLYHLFKYTFQKINVNIYREDN